jgi:hypothetical protein
MKICSVRNRCLTGMKSKRYYWWKWTAQGLIATPRGRELIDLPSTTSPPQDPVPSKGVS